MQYDLSLNILGYIFLLVLSVFYLKSRIFPNRANYWFKTIIYAANITILLDILTAYTINNSATFPLALNYILNTLSFIFYGSLAFIFQRYLLVVTKTEKSHKLLINISEHYIYPIILALVLTTAFTKQVFYFDSNRIYHHGPLYIYCVIALLVVIVSGVIVVLFKNDKITKVQKFVIPLYSFLIIISSFVQAVFPQLWINDTILALAIYIMFLTLQNPNEYRDRVSNKYSRFALIEHLYKLVTENKPFQFISIDIAGTDRYNKIFGENVGNSIILAVAEKISDNINAGLVFKLGGDSFLVITEKIKNHNKNLELLKDAFPFVFEINGMDIEINVHLSYSAPLLGFQNEDEAFSIIKESTKIAKQNGNILINNNTIEKLKRKNQVENAVKQAANGIGLTVYIQPVYNTKKEKFTFAEALCRIQDPKLGLLAPDEFIPIAEKTGLISKIDTQMFEKVCEYLSGTDVPSYFEKISVNLSVIDCMNPHLADTVITAAQHYNISPSKLVLEITETMATIAPQLHQTVKKLQKFGIAIAMDDFGTGYANMDSLLSLPFEFVKIDHSVLNMLYDSSYSVILQGFLDILDKLQLISIVEGVETEQQLNKILAMHCHYIQGYYFAKPMPLSQFTEFLNSH